MHRRKCLLLLLAALCGSTLLLGLRRLGAASGGGEDADLPSSNFLRERVRALPGPAASTDEDSPPVSDLADNFNNFRYFYRLAATHMDRAMHWMDRLDTQLPLMRISADEESPEFRAVRAAKWLRSQSLAVVATARDAMPGLRSSIDNIRRLCSKFAHCSIVFLENDSRDDTRKFLHELTKSDPNVTLLGCGRVNSPDPCQLNVSYSTGKRHQTGYAMRRNLLEEIERGMLMNALRNQLLAFVYSRLANNHSMLLNIDPDLYWSPWDERSMLQGLYYFASRPKLDSLCPNTFDYYGLRRVLHDPCTLRFRDNYHHFTENSDGQREAVVLERSKWPIKVNSCFQGLTFYRMKSLYSRRLLYRKGHGEWICEHNTLSRQLNENYIDPNMRLRVALRPFVL